MKRILIGFVASLAMVSFSAGAFAQANSGTSGGTGKNNTIEEQTGKATSSSPGSIDPKDVSGGAKKDSTADVAPGTPDNRNKSPMGTPDPSGPTVK